MASSPSFCTGTQGWKGERQFQELGADVVILYHNVHLDEIIYFHEWFGSTSFKCLPAPVPGYSIPYCIPETLTV